MQLQLTWLFPELIKLQTDYGDPNLDPIYGAGCIDRPNIMFILMNPTGKNLSANKSWNGMKAPWVGTKNIWKLLYRLELMDMNFFNRTQNLKTDEWTAQFVEDLYAHIATNKLYLTSLAKCTIIDARPLSNSVFKAYLHSTFQEITTLKPKYIISFGNHVSSILLSKSVKVSDFLGATHKLLKIDNKKFKVYPTYYPVGQGMRNMAFAIDRIKSIMQA